MEEKKKSEQEQFNADKQAALDQGYSEEQAVLYANQEALDRKTNGAEPTQGNVNTPVSGNQNNVPPSTIGNPNYSMKSQQEAQGGD